MVVDRSEVPHRPSLPTRYSAPASIEALKALLDDDPGATLIAGGQSLLPPLLAGDRAASHLIDIRNVEALRRLEVTPNHLFLGAGLTFSELLQGPATAAVPALGDALRHVGTHGIRNRATLGGNLAWGDPRAEVPMILMLLDAVIQTDRRTLPAADFSVAPFRTRLERGEIIIGVTVPLGPDQRAARFRELIDRRSAGKAIISVAACPRRIAIGGLFDRPVVASAPADGIEPTLAALERRHSPLPDPFHSYEYRRAMVAVLLQRASASG